MNIRIYIALFAALSAVCIGSAATHPRVMKSVEVLDQSGARHVCSIGTDGSRLFVLVQTGIEVFEQSGPGLDVSSPSSRVLRSGDMITILHPGGFTVFEKAPQPKATGRVTSSATPSRGTSKLTPDDQANKRPR